MYHSIEVMSTRVKVVPDIALLALFYEVITNSDTINEITVELNANTKGGCNVLPSFFPP